MKRWTRAVAVAALVAGLMVTGAGAGAQTEGSAYSSNFEIDIVVRGAPSPDASIIVRTPGSVGGESHSFALADAAGAPDLNVASDTIYRFLYIDPTDDAGASRVHYACTIREGPPAPPPDTPASSCTGVQGSDDHWPTAHVDTWFQGHTNTYAEVTITLTFGRCDGRAATVLLGDGDTPTAGADVILGTAGAETINGLGGDDRICGGGGPDTIRGGSGTDRLFGSNGADRLEGGLHGDRLFGQDGDDTLLGQDGTDVLDGGANRDNCNGGPGVDQGPRCEVKTSIP